MRKQYGLSLIELMISITLGLILMTGVVQLFISSKNTFTTQQALSRIQESGRLAIDFMAKDIRMAGYMGCASRGANPTLVWGLDDNGSDYVHEFDMDADGLVDFNAGIVGMTAADFKTDSGLDVVSGTDVVIVRGASSTAMPIVSSTGNTANIDVLGTEVDGCVGDICEGELAIISDCAQGRIFRITNLQANGGGNGTINLVHSNASGNPGNKDAQLGGQQFDAGAEILRVNTIAYYVAQSPTSGRRGLWQRINDEPPFELMEGVQDMNITYGVQTVFYDAQNVPDWAAVDSVRIELLVRSLEDNVVPDPQPYTFAGTVVTPNDRRMSQVFSSTIAIRNRLQ